MKTENVRVVLVINIHVVYLVRSVVPHRNTVVMMIFAKKKLVRINLVVPRTNVKVACFVMCKYLETVKHAMMPVMDLGPLMDPVLVEAGKSMHLLLNTVQHQVPNI